MAQAQRVSITATETLQVHEPKPPPEQQPPPPEVQTLTLRLAPRMKKKVSWREDTVDNEDMQKKKSKICCIFHKDDESCDSDDDEDDEGKGKGKEQDHHSDCNHANGQHSEHGSTSSS
jgi:protein phosphatase 1 regulatory subunit 11